MLFFSSKLLSILSVYSQTAPMSQGSDPKAWPEGEAGCSPWSALRAALQEHTVLRTWKRGHVQLRCESHISFHHLPLESTSIPQKI